MRLKKSFQLALNILVHSKLRSWLTIIGIVIGIAAVVSIVSISQGAQQTLESSFSNLGADIITVSPGYSRARGFGFGGEREGGGPPGSSSSLSGKNLTAKDVMALKSVQNVKYVMGTVSGRVDVSYLGKTASLSVTGVDSSIWSDITTEKISSGRFLIGSDSYSVVIGNRVATSVFEKAIPLNSKITIEGKSFKVVGILQEGSSIFMPEESARQVLTDVGSEEFGSISVKIADVNFANQTLNDITKKLMLSRGILNDKGRDFSVSSPTSMQATIQSTLNTMTIFLGAIAAISLIVGAIGIANSMFTSVLEKTRDIGILKAIGSKNRDILMIFLFNSGMIGFIGGLGGVILGGVAASLISSMSGITTSTGGGPGGFLSRLGSTALLTPQLIIGALFFAVLIGVIAGVVPAYRASKLKPVDALRYE